MIRTFKSSTRLKYKKLLIINNYDSLKAWAFYDSNLKLFEVWIVRIGPAFFKFKYLNVLVIRTIRAFLKFECSKVFELFLKIEYSNASNHKKLKSE